MNQHHEAAALAWEALSPADKNSLLGRLGLSSFDARWRKAAAHARWLDLPTHVSAGLQQILPEDLVQRCSDELHKRERAQS